MNLPTIELIFDQDCPNVEATRDTLKKALLELNLPLRWKEWDQKDKNSPEHAKKYGSPTILVNGKDLIDIVYQSANCCRIYPTANNPCAKTPDLEMIKDVINEALNHNISQRAHFLSLSAIPAAIVALLPSLSCPACWPMYASLLSSLGISFFDYTPYKLPLLLILLVIALYGLAYSAKKNKNYRPLTIGIAGAIILLSQEYGPENMVYLGTSLLITASIWSMISTSSCPR